MNLRTAVPMLLCLSFAAPATAAIYDGTLLFQDNGAIDTGLSVVSGNADGWLLHTRIQWQVTDEDLAAPAGHPWRYTYTVTVRKYALSHLVLELSDSFTLASLTEASLNGSPFSSYSVGTQENNAGSPTQPETVYGVKFDSLGDGVEDDDGNVTHTIEFFSDRMPVWSDVYLKCGGFGNSAWNDGFTVGDADPTDGPSSGSVGAHVLAPNSVPEPATLVLLLAGAGALVGRRRRGAAPALGAAGR